MTDESIPAVRPRSGQTIERAAFNIVADFSPTTLSAEVSFPVFEFCEFALEDATGVVFGVEDLPPGVEGRFEGNSLIIDSNVYEEAQEHDGRARFTLAHEVGHCVLHASELRTLNHPSQSFVQLHRRKSIPAYRDPEWQANRFAGALLMPWQAVLAIDEEEQTSFEDSRPLMPLWWNVAVRLQVSNQAGRVRLEVLEMN